VDIWKQRTGGCCRCYLWELVSLVEGVFQPSRVGIARKGCAGHLKNYGSVLSALLRDLVP